MIRRNDRSRIRVGCLALLFVCAAAYSLPSKDLAQSAGTISRQFEEHYRHMRTMRAVFLQRYSEGPHEARIESGTVYFSRPGRMRWEYESPEKHLFVSDGKTIWSYVPSDRAVTRLPVKESSDWRTPLALLTGRVDLDRLCGRIEIGAPASSGSGHVILRCLPKGEKESRPSSKSAAPQNSDEIPTSEDFTEVRVEIDPKTGQLDQVEIRQSGGIVLEYRFGGWQENLALPESIFHFVAPEGIAIVDGAALHHSAP